MRVSVADAKNKLPELIKAAESGEPVTICRRGLPVVDLVPTKIGGGQQPRFGTLVGRVVVNDSEWWKPLSEDEVAAFLAGRY
jgi:prevent-host-death family protein